MEAEASSKDLLQRFAGITTLSDRPPPAPAVVTAAGVVSGQEVELSLGLSLGGCFGANPRERSGKLIRSSSISSFPFLDSNIKKEDALQVGPAQQLQRTCSLPVPSAAADEDYRKRKEMQSLKRLEAKRKRYEKRNSSCVKGGGDEAGGGSLWNPGTQAAARLPPLAQQGSIGSVGSSSSVGGSMIGFDITRFNNSSEARSSLTHNHSPNHNNNETKNLERKSSGGEKNVMEEMPCVSTKGLPNGKKIEGFLYKYRKGEEVRIVCVCHGSFLTPAEFVRHAGGGEVDHPLRHIVVNASPFPL